MFLQEIKAEETQTTSKRYGADIRNKLSILNKDKHCILLDTLGLLKSLKELAL